MAFFVQNGLELKSQLVEGNGFIQELLGRPYRNWGLLPCEV